MTSFASTARLVTTKLAYFVNRASSSAAADRAMTVALGRDGERAAALHNGGCRASR
jgi:hypothetical protein